MLSRTKTCYFLLAMGILCVLGITSAFASGGLRTVALRGTAAPGKNLGVSFNLLGILMLNRNGQTAFVTNLTGTGVNGSNNSAIFSEGSGSGLMLVTRGSEIVPDTSPGDKL